MLHTLIALLSLLLTLPFGGLTFAQDRQQSNRSYLPQQRRPQSQEAREQYLNRLRAEHHAAQQEYERQQRRINRLQRLERPAEYVGKAADLAMKLPSKTGPQGFVIKQLYKGVQQSLRDPEGAQRREKAIQESRLRSQQYREEQRERREAFDRGIGEFNRKVEDSLRHPPGGLYKPD